MRAYADSPDQPFPLRQEGPGLDLLPASPEDERSWLVVHTKPRCEKKFSLLLRAECFEHELPLVTSIRRYRTQTKRFSKPLFPGYVFVRLQPALRSRLFQQDLLVRIIPVENQTLFVSQLETIRAMIRSGLELQLTPPLEKGTKVRIMGGALYGVEGVVDDPKHPRGVVVSVDVLRQGVLVRIAPELLEVVTGD
ncbi:MAG: transcription termination/antitermination protein NusG [Opitutaceae bacterium]